MAQLTQRELDALETLLRYEQSLYEKFHHYAEHAGESATRKLCKQLGDRSREHVSALIGALKQPGALIH